MPLLQKLNLNNFQSLFQKNENICSRKSFRNEFFFLFMSQNIVPGTDIKIDNGYITVLDPFMMSEILVNTSCNTL